MAEQLLSDVEHRVTEEAFRRGATVDEIVALLVSRRVVPTGAAGQLGGGVPVGDADARTVAVLPARDPGAPLPDPRPGVEAAYATLLAETDAEFATLPDLARRGFRPLKDEPFGSDLEKYRFMRAVYHREGWRCPHTAIFAHIVPATFFGRPVAGGVHSTMLPLLARVEAFVRRLNPAAARQMSGETFSVGGFVPRHVAGSDELSNHAFGLALDIDPDWNPMLKGNVVLVAFRRATGVDFGQWLYAASSVDALAEVYKRVAAASERLKVWLRRLLPAYHDEEIMRADLDRALKKASTRAAARAKLKELDEQVSGDPDRAALKVLVDAYGITRVRGWADHGVITIPAAVVHAWEGAHPLCRWGGNYQHSKDMMHLEVLARSALSRARTARVRDLADLARGEPPARPACAPITWSDQAVLGANRR
ncbi:hypothetical protein [Nonomuraea cavernae]|uniref:Uncharacterized protein n=1 Tax=Nonomuraea cavernae TaxID=2045107 RepID=A0A917ZJS9_9ACTN|nr:hypothetical protein [Nonomuraea cavernae]MCA2190933.1 M15 family metallopeptidase [Nonomuraea cavernae]GGO83289.1 hypothetical protein GCM10012289_76420 [Nonomuraea cavernae]